MPVAGGVVLGIRLRFHNHAPEQLTIRLAFHQQAADELGSDDLGGAAEEGLGEVLGERGGYGSGLVSKHCCHPAANPRTGHPTQTMQRFASG
jgi:hypothetical protein